MTSSKETLTVYWSTPMVNEQESWSHLYQDPVHVINSYRKKQNLDAKFGTFFSCPAVTDTFKNTFVFMHPLDNEFQIPRGIENIPIENNQRVLIDTDSKVSIYKQRKESIEGYTNISYNMGWIFFAEEPLIAKFTAPYFPSVSPAEGALFATGEYDIGSWFRHFNVDYHIPFGTYHLKFKENEPLFFVEFKTNKKVILKRFTMNNILMNFATECSSSPGRYGILKSLAFRYEKAKKANFPELVLSEIKKNLIN